MKQMNSRVKTQFNRIVVKRTVFFLYFVDTQAELTIWTQKNTLHFVTMRLKLKTALNLTTVFLLSYLAYTATSLKFLSYPQCIQPAESKLHPGPGSSIVLMDPCDKLPNLFKLHRDGVIQHLVSGMCIQGVKNGDPLNTAHGDNVILNYPCTLYRPGYNTPHALQFKFTRGGSLMEIKSGKCISGNQGRPNNPLTFSTTCDTPDTTIGFIGWYFLEVLLNMLAN